MKKYRISSNQTSAKIGDETVMLDHKNGLYFALNEVGTVVWESLSQSPKSFDELREVILAEYAVTEEELTEDLQEILSHLNESNLTEVFEDE